MPSLTLQEATAVQLRAILADYGLSHAAVNPKAPPFGATGDGSTDDTDAIQTAFAHARAYGLPVAFPPGTYKISDTLVVDWNYAKIMGWSASIRPTAACPVAMYVGPVADLSNQEVWIEGLGFRGTGNFADNQTLVKFHDVAGKRVRMAHVKLEAASVGLNTRGCDYTLLEQLFVKGCETGWLCGEWTNVAKAVGCAFAGKNLAGNASVTSKHVHLQGIASLVMETCEFGDGDYGIYADNTTDNRSLMLIGHRDERVRISDIQWGTGTSGALPNFLTVDNCEFMGDAGEAARNCISINGGTHVTVRNSLMSQVSSGHRLVKCHTAASKVVVENCQAESGYVWEDAAAATSNARQILNNWS